MGGCLRLLLVDDDVDGLFLLNRAMKREFPDAETIACCSAVEALAELDRNPVDIVITDHRMPVISGIEFARRLREAGFRKPVVMLTGSSEKESEALAAGVSTFLSGGSWPQIQRVVREVVEREARARNPDLPELPDRS